MTVISRKKRVLVVDDLAIFREPLVTALEAEGYYVAQAASGSDAIQLLRKTVTPFDLLLLDHVMPGMSGLAVLEKIRSTPEWRELPVVMLTETGDLPVVLRYKELKVSHYFLKAAVTFQDVVEGLKEVLEHVGDEITVRGRVRERTAPVLLKPKPASAAGALKSKLSGKAVSTVVCDVLTVANTNVNTANVAATIGRDAFLATEVLRLSNSAALAPRRGTNLDLVTAVEALGFDKVRYIAASVGLLNLVPASLSDRFNYLKAWQHSFACAGLTAELLKGTDSEGTGYLAGLCLDLARTALHSAVPDLMTAVEDKMRDEGVSEDEAMKAVLKMSRSAVAELVLTELQVPTAVRQPIVAHLDSSNPLASPDRMVRALGLSHYYANAMQLCPSVNSKIAPITVSEFKETAGSLEADFQPTALRSEVLTMTSVLAKLPPEEESRLSADHCSKRNVQVCYVKSDELHHLEPVGLALTRMCDVVSMAKLPSSDKDLEGFSGLLYCAQQADPSELQHISGLAKGRSIPAMTITRGHTGGNSTAAGITTSTYPLPLSALNAFVNHCAA